VSARDEVVKLVDRALAGHNDTLNDGFVVVSDAIFARMAESEIDSMSPAPKTGAGIRKMMFEFPCWPAGGSPAGPEVGLGNVPTRGVSSPADHEEIVSSPSLAPLELSGVSSERCSSPTQERRSLHVWPSISKIPVCKNAFCD